IVKFLSTAELDTLAVQPGETLLFAAGEWAQTSRVLSALRLHVGRELGLVDEDAFAFLWVTDFPMFEWDDDEARWSAVHHPFTRPSTPTTSSSTETSWAEARSGSTNRTCRRRCSTSCSSARRSSAPSSASSSTPSPWARRRTVASHSVSTA